MRKFIKDYDTTLDKEFGFINKALRQYVCFDFVVPNLKKCIEFNGDVYHANQKLFKESDTPNYGKPNMTSTEIWEYDRIKNQSIKDKGYDLLIVWEHDYNEDKDKELNRCIEFLRN